MKSRKPRSKSAGLAREMVIFSGPPGIGKTTAIKEACRRLTQAVYVSVDRLRKFVRTGYHSPVSQRMDSYKHPGLKCGESDQGDFENDQVGKMRKLDLAIIIPCATDVRISRCLQSIYQTCVDEVEILVSLNGASEAVKKILNDFPAVNVCEIDEANLSRAYNNGLRHTQRSHVLLMDSDCVFSPGTINLIYDGLKCGKLSKGLVIFKHNNLMSKTIAQVREYTTTDFVNAYSPPLAFAKDIINLVGGYYFHEQVRWSEDSEFNYRVQRAGLKIRYNPRAIIYHAPLSLKEDVRSGFRYGQGKRTSEELGLLPKTRYFQLAQQKKKFVKTYEVLREKGWLPATYYFFIWRPANRVGYIYQALKSRRNFRRDK